jgi:dolichol-phosphate mannosyltransferase
MISIIIPTYNESANIKKIAKQLNKLIFKKEIIFVDDNSQDNTALNIRNLNKNKNKKYKLIIRKNKIRDLSQSVYEGVKLSSSNLILVMDADLQHSVKYCNPMLKILNKNKLDLIVGSRFLRNNIITNISFFRSIFSIFFVYFINIFFGKKTSDPLSGFFLCKKEIILKYRRNFFLKGYKILFDILYNGKKYIKVQDFSIVFKSRQFGKSKFNLRILLIFLNQMFFTFSRKIL